MKGDLQGWAALSLALFVFAVWATPAVAHGVAAQASRYNGSDSESSLMASRRSKLAYSGAFGNTRLQTAAP